MISNDSTLEIGTDATEVKPAVPGEGDVPNTNYEAIAKEEYYQDVNLDLTGEALEEELRTKISVMTKLSYGEDSNIMLYTDE